MILIKHIFLSTNLLFFASIGLAQTISQKQMLKRVSDFSVTEVSDRPSNELSNKNLSDNKNCREHIEEVICLVDPIENPDRETDLFRPCLPGSKLYSKYFEALYDNFPQAFQKMFCSLKHIYIEKEFFGTAYAGLLKNKAGEPVGAQMGIRKSVLDENLNLSLWASWKEQLSFGGVADSYTLKSHLPMIRTASNANLNDFLYFVVAHEFGHIFDFINEINRVKDCFGEVEECKVQEDSWGAISWKTDLTPKPENDFSNRKGLCFYWCKGSPLPADAVSDLFRSLFKTDFISTYATTQPWDDFADSLAYFLMNKYLGSSYVIDTKDGNEFNIMEKVNSPLWERKFKFIEEFLDTDNISYP